MTYEERYNNGVPFAQNLWLAGYVVSRSGMYGVQASDQS